MALKSFKPVTPSQRGLVLVELHREHFSVEDVFQRLTGKGAEA